MRIRQVLAFVPASILLSAAIAQGAVTAWTDVIVRIYDASGVMTGTKQRSLDLASKTLEWASVRVIWRLCPNARTTATPCDAPMAPSELAIRIVRSHTPEKDPGRLPLGDALVDTRAGAGVLATIYFDRVLWLADQAGTDSQTLLGRTIAHELGHLLLATASHGPVGLMRSVWSLEEVRRGRQSDWTFAPLEVAALRLRAQTSPEFWGTR